MKREQERVFSNDPYIRFAMEISVLESEHSTNSSLDKEAQNTPFRVAICMTKQSSTHLLHAQFLQSDIGFKRIVGFKEFVLGGQDSDSRQSKHKFEFLYINIILLIILGYVYCRVYLNRQTAAAHQFVFQKISEIVKLDTGHELLWRHLHSSSANLEDACGILQITVDQHGGQAKGIFIP